MKTYRYTFEFSATATVDIEAPDDVEEESDAFEKILQRAAGDIDLNAHADWQDAYPAKDGD